MGKGTPTAGQRDRQIVIQRGTPTTDEYGGEALAWTDFATGWARVRFGTAQEKRQEVREAAQEGGVQSATFELLRHSLLDQVTLKDRIWFMDSAWDISEAAPLDRATIRFTAARLLTRDEA